MNGWIVILVVILLLAAFGLFSKIWTWAKAAFTSVTGKTVNVTLDGQISQWLATAESAKTQGLLRLAQVGFSSRGDADSIAAIKALITKAATWDDDPPATVETVSKA